jgi:hypothetical protein
VFTLFVCLQCQTTTTNKKTMQKADRARNVRTERMDGHVTIKVGDYTAKVSLNARTYKHVQQGRGQRAKDGLIVRTANICDKVEQTMFAVSHKARIEERSAAQRDERRAKRRK